jgi:hypothetical protein
MARPLDVLAESLRSHAVVSAAEMSRRSKRVVELKDGLPVM